MTIIYAFEVLRAKNKTQLRSVPFSPAVTEILEVTCGALCRGGEGLSPCLAEKAVCAAFMSSSLDFAEMAHHQLRRARSGTEAEQVSTAIDLAARVPALQSGNRHLRQLSEPSGLKETLVGLVVKAGVNYLPLPLSMIDFP